MFRERFSYAPFVWPFVIGLIFFLCFFVAAIVRVFKELPQSDKIKFGKSLFTKQTLVSIKEIFMECLLHRRIFQRDPLLGFMHMSIAFGWFMIIVLGHIEVKLYCPNHLNLPYFPIFFRYFVKQTDSTLGGAIFFFLMDFFLLMILIGIGIAIYKRINSRIVGMRRTTRLKIYDWLALYSLWSIFPLRLLAESFTSSISGGSFLTRGFGLLFDSFVSNSVHVVPTWWAYSTALGVFFIAMPFSRYMHILTEPFLILLRNAGIRTVRHGQGYALTETFACSRCGICLDPCQMVLPGRMDKKATVYFISNLRYNHMETAREMAEMCMQCGRCVAACPVGIDSCRLKLSVKTDNQMGQGDTYLQYLNPASDALPAEIQPVVRQMPEKPDVVYFAGCMSHLTPAIPRAMQTLFKAAGIRYRYLDENGSVCCGRPLMLAGQEEAARQLIAKNTELIVKSGAQTLVTSCPICYRVFTEEYKLPIRVVHHTVFIRDLIAAGKLSTEPVQERVTYHDPCDLGRGSGIYEAPREILKDMAVLQRAYEEKDQALCCGGSLGSNLMPYETRRKIAADAFNRLTFRNPDVLVTACPLCKKTFQDVADRPVLDIAQYVATHLRAQKADAAPVEETPYRAAV